MAGTGTSKLFSQIGIFSIGLLFLMASCTIKMDDGKIIPRAGKGTVEFVEGKIGQAASFGQGCLQYNAKECIKAKAGTIEMWIKSSYLPEDIKDGFLFSASSNITFWFFGAINGGVVNLLYKNGEKPYRNEGEYYANSFAGLKDWKEKEWHYLAFVWANIGKGKSLVEIYVDGVIKEGRYNLSIGDRFDADIFGIGYNTRNKKSGFPGAIDEFRISNYPKTAEEIKDSFKRGTKGIPLTLEEGTLLLLHFDGTTDGVGRTNAGIDDVQIKKQVDRIIKNVIRN